MATEEREIRKELEAPIFFWNETPLRSHSPIPWNDDTFDRSPITPEHPSPTFEEVPTLDLSGQESQHQNLTEQNASNIRIETTCYTTDRLPDVTASLDRQYEISFDNDILTLSVEESGKNVRLCSFVCYYVRNATDE